MMQGQPHNNAIVARSDLIWTIILEKNPVNGDKEECKGADLT